MKVDKPINISFIVAQGFAVVIVMAAIMLMPGADLFATTAAFIAMWGVVAGSYRLTSARTRAGWWTLLIACVLLALGIVANVYVATTLKGTTTAHPVWNNSDMEEFFREGRYWLGESEFAYWKRTRWGYGLLLALTWFITGRVSLVSALIVNALATAISIVISGVITRRLLQGRVSWSGARLQTAGMIATASVTYFLFSGTLVLRESIISLSVALMGLAMIDLYRRNWTRGILVYLAGASILIVTRSSWLPLTVIGAIAAARPDWRSLAIVSALIVVMCGEWGAIDQLFRDGGSTEYYDERTVMSPHAFLHDTPSHASYNALLGQRYYEAEWYGKIAMMPAAAAVQYFTPLPWAFSREIDVAPTLVLVKFTYPWLIIGGLVIYFILGKARRSPGAVARMTAWAVIYWLITVYVSGGSVPRYGVPLLPLVVPAAIYTLATSWGRAAFKRWCWGYGALVVAALSGMYYIQHSFIS